MEENNNKTPAKGCLIFWLSFLAGNIFQFIILIAILLVCNSLNLNTQTEGLLNNIFINLFLYLGLYGGMFLIFTCQKSKPQIFKKPTLLKCLLYTLTSIATFFMLNPVISCISNWLVNAGLTPPQPTFALTTPNYFIALIFLVFLPATVEELLFRGLIFANMSKQGKTFATITTTLLFSLFHTSIFQTVYPILFGLLLCVIMLREENIYYCMIAHAVNNFLALTSMFFGWKLFSTSTWFIILSFVLAIIYLCAVIFIFVVSKQKIYSDKQRLTKKDILFLFLTFVILITIWICSSFLV